MFNTSDDQSTTPFQPIPLVPIYGFSFLSVSASLKRIHFRRFGVGHWARRRVRNTPVRWLLHMSKQS